VLTAISEGVEGMLIRGAVAASRLATISLACVVYSGYGMTSAQLDEIGVVRESDLGPAALAIRPFVPCHLHVDRVRCLVGDQIISIAK
jgi:hypothetical protein